METSLPAQESPSSGDQAEATPARAWRWSSLFARRATLPDCPAAAPRRQRRRLAGLPLPGGRIAYYYYINRAREMPETFVILDDVVQHTLSNLHSIQKSIVFWQSKAMRTDSQKVYYMIFQRGPRAFVETTCQTLARIGSNGSPLRHLSNSASAMFSTKLGVLKRMQHSLASFLAEIYYEVDKFVVGSSGSSDKLLHALFTVLNTAFYKLEVALTNACEGGTLLSTHEANSYELIFQPLPEVDGHSSSTAGTSLIYENLQKLDNFLSFQLSSHKKPRKMTIYWLPYTCGALGLSACSLWLLYHSSLMGSSDIGNWIHGAKELFVGYWDENVQKLIVAARYLLGTLDQSKSLAGKQVHPTEEPLHRKISSYLLESYEKIEHFEHTTFVYIHCICGKEPTGPIDIPVKDMVYFKDQTEKILADLKEAALELERFLKARRIIVYACGRWLLLRVLLVPACAMLGQSAARRAGAPQRKLRLLLSDVEKRLSEFQHCMVNGMEEDARCMFGLTLCSLDRLCKDVDVWRAREIWERDFMRNYVLRLARTDLGVADKLGIVSRFVEVFCKV